MNPFVAAVVTGVLSGGLFGGIGSFLLNRSLARKAYAEAKASDARLPVELDSLTVQGAEQAVLTMKTALESAGRRIDQLEQEREDDRERIAALERKVRDLQRKVDAAHRDVADAQRRSQEIQAELAAFRQDRSGRG